MRLQSHDDALGYPEHACCLFVSPLQVFEAFDELLLMKRGGRIVYNGKLKNQGVGSRVSNRTCFFAVVRNMKSVGTCAHSIFYSLATSLSKPCQSSFMLEFQFGRTTNTIKQFVQVSSSKIVSQVSQYVPDRCYKTG